MDGPAVAVSETVAVLDVGSNTIRLLVGRRNGNEVEPLCDRSEFARLGKDVDRTGRLQSDRMTAGIEAIRTLAGAAQEEGATRLVAIATSAVRDAANGREFVTRVQAETGVHIEIVTGDREAQLTFRGATLGLSLDGGAIVCDLGGGSAELLFADAEGIRWSASEPLGSNRLTERFVRHDPPHVHELEELSACVISVVHGLPPARATSAVLTGGTATHLAWLLGQDGVDSCFVPEDLARAVQIVSGMSSEQVVALYGFRPERALVLPAGLTALLTIVGVFGVDAVLVTRRGIREGALLEATS